MRLRDDNKSDAIYSATIDLLNEIGFSGISMSKIAKRAKVSASTIYVYFENKDDMLRKTYVYVKNSMLGALDDILDDRLSVKDTVERLMRKCLEYLLEHKAYFLFCEQFDTSPLLVKYDLTKQYEEMMAAYHRFVDEAKRKGSLKDMDTALLVAYCYYPVVYLAKKQFSSNGKLSAELVNQTIYLSWQAIKA